MRTIRKGSEPPCLLEERAAKRRYGDLVKECKDAIRVALARDQGSLCCYCLGRIRPDESSMVIEHLVPQTDPSRGRELELDWNNLLGSCHGNPGKPPAQQHCDERKGNASLEMSPLDPRVRSTVHYLTSGHVTSNSEEVRRDLDEKLNLNVAFLVRNRRAVLDAFFVASAKRRPGTWTVDAVDKWIGGLTTGSELQEYGEIVVQFLEKKRKRLATH